MGRGRSRRDMQRPFPASIKMEKINMFQEDGEAGELGRAPLKTTEGQGSHNGLK